jgi:hypothetical protein
MDPPSATGGRLVFQPFVNEITFSLASGGVFSAIAFDVAVLDLFQYLQVEAFQPASSLAVERLRVFPTSGFVGLLFGAPMGRVTISSGLADGGTTVRTVSLDNVAASTATPAMPVPEPSTLLLFGAAIMLLRRPTGS